MNKHDSEKVLDKFGKLTIKEPYSKTRFLPRRIRGYIDLLRPFTLLAPIIVSSAIMVASLIYNRDGTGIDQNWWFIVGNASFTMAIVNAASNVLNQATDVEADRLSKPYRPIPRGVVKADEAQSIAYIFYLFALIRAVTINVWFGFFVFLIMLFTVTYSLPPRIKKYLFLNQVWIALPRGFFGVLAAWSVFGDPFQKLPLAIGAIATTYLIGGMATKDIVDSDADKKTGTHTMINTYGSKKTALVSFPFMFFPFALVLPMINEGWLEHYLWPLVFLLIPSCLIFYFMIRETESKTLENVHAWSIMYIEYIFFALGFSLLVIFSGLESFPFNF